MQSSSYSEAILCILYTLQKSKDSSVGIATGYGLDDQMIGIQFPSGAGVFPFDTMSRLSCGAHQASYAVGTRGFFPGGKAAGA
jgi:hypothetical protein